MKTFYKFPSSCGALWVNVHSVNDLRAAIVVLVVSGNLGLFFSNQVWLTCGFVQNRRDCRIKKIHLTSTWNKFFQKCVVM